MPLLKPNLLKLLKKKNDANVGCVGGVAADVPTKPCTHPPAAIVHWWWI
jgi:hypothetical protein